MNDIFPSTFSSIVLPVKHPQSSRQFKTIYHGCKTLKASEIILKKDTIHFSPIDGCNEQLLKLFFKAGKDSYFPKYFHPRQLIWNNVATCLKRKSIFSMNNTKNRICFRYGNTYLTNRYFTFGLRYVNTGTDHIYQTTNIPMLIHILPSPSTKNIELKKLKNSVFDAKDQYLYNLHIMEPNRIYKIPEHTYYLIITTQCTLFSVNIVKSNILIPFSLLRNPRDSKNYNKKKNKPLDSKQQLTPLNHAQTGDNESVSLSLAIDSSAEKNNQQTPNKTHRSSSQPYISPSSSPIELLQHNAEEVEISEHITGAISTISSEVGSEAYRQLDNCRENVLRLAPPEYVQWFKNLKEQIFGHPTDYFVPIIEEDAVPLDLSCTHPGENYTDFGMDSNFEKELLALSYEELLDFFKNV